MRQLLELAPHWERWRDCRDNKPTIDRAMKVIGESMAHLSESTTETVEARALRAEAQAQVLKGKVISLRHYAKHLEGCPGVGSCICGLKELM